MAKNIDANLNSSFSSSFNNLLFWPQAWYRRGKANASLGNYKNAICDLNVAKSVEPSMGGKRQIEGELKILLDQCKSTTAVEQIQHTENNCNTVGKKFSLLRTCTADSSNYPVGEVKELLSVVSLCL